MASTEWSKETIYEFLEFFENEPILWNPSTPGHKNRGEAYTAWKRIASKMGNRFDVNELKKKKESLMASYRTAVNKVKATANTEKPYRPTWFAFNKLASILQNKDLPRMYSEEEEDHKYVMDNTAEVALETEILEWDGDVRHQNLTLPSSSSKPMNKTTQKNKRRWTDTQSHSDNKMDISYLLHSIPKQVPNERDERNVCSIYGELVAAKLKLMDDRTREICMNRIDNILFEMKMGSTPRANVDKDTRNKQIEDKEIQQKCNNDEEIQNETYHDADQFLDISSEPSVTFENISQMSSEDFNHLLSLVEPLIAKKDTKWKKAIPAHERLAITLRFLVTGDSFKNLHYLFKVSPQLISKIVPEVCGAIIKVLEDYLKIPENPDEWRTIAESFDKKWNFPHCLGALGGRHITTSFSFRVGSEPSNYKQKSSVVLMALVDADYCFTFADCDSNGNLNEEEVYRNSSLYKKIDQNELNIPQKEPLPGRNIPVPYIIVGDDVFGLSTSIMVPYPGEHPDNSTAGIFNYHLSQTHRVAQNALGVLAYVFRVLRKPMLLQPENISLVVMACVFLHNFLRRSESSRLLYSPDGTFDYEEDGNLILGSWCQTDTEDLNSFLPLKTIYRKASNNAEEVKKHLCVFIQYGFIIYEANKSGIAEYHLQPEKILFLLRYPKYLSLIEKKFGETSKFIIEELLKRGRLTATKTIIQVWNKMKTGTTAKFNNKVSVLISAWNELVHKQYLLRCPIPDNDLDRVPHLVQPEETLMHQPVTLEAANLIKIERGDKSVSDDDHVFWTCNFDRFHQDLRDEIMINAIRRRFDDHAARLMEVILRLCYVRTDAWATQSNPVPVIEIRDTLEKAKSDPYLLQFLEQYLKIIEDDTCRFIKRSSEAITASVTVNFVSAFSSLTHSTIENIVDHKFGAKAARIFRLVQNKVYIDQEQLQKIAMIPDKEAKQITYKLLHESFLYMHELKKSVSSGPVKNFYLFHVNFNQVNQVVLDMCFKTVTNTLARASHDKTENMRLIEKFDKLNTIAATMREQGNDEETIQQVIDEFMSPPERSLLESVEKMIQKLRLVELNIDETIFIIQLYSYYDALTLMEKKIERNKKGTVLK